MRIGIYTNRSRDPDLSVTKRFISLLEQGGIDFCLSNLIGQGANCFDNGTLAQNSDILAVFGGDGTVLSVVGEAAKRGKPVLAVNTGNLGFLTGAESGELDAVVNSLKNRDFSTVKRSMLWASVKGEDFYALNEVVLMRECQASVVKIAVYNNGRFVENYRADGVIVSTPTGSTAYALSAGGAVLAPDLKAVELVPVSPHSLTCRPIVFPDTDTITLKAEGKTCVLVCDGVSAPQQVLKGEEVKISRAAFDAVFVIPSSVTPHNFYERLVKKMRV